MIDLTPHFVCCPCGLCSGPGGHEEDFEEQEINEPTEETEKEKPNA